MPLDKSALIVLTATIALAWALMLSQAIESVTRVFYARADLDLIMSSPAKLTNVFSVRIAAIALAVTGMALLFATPFVDMLAILGGARWLAAFGVVIAIGAVGRGHRDRNHAGPVPPDRPAPHAARRPDRGRCRRRRICHRAADRRDPVLRLAVALCLPHLGFGHRLCARPRQFPVVAGARGARRYRGAGSSAAGRARPARRRDGAVLATLCRHRDQGLGKRRRFARRRAATAHSAAARAAWRCGARNSCC